MKYNCLFIGNAIMDILTDVDFDFMISEDIQPGSWRPVSKEEIENLQKKVAEKYGYKLVDHKLELYGVKKKP